MENRTWGAAPTDRELALETAVRINLATVPIGASEKHDVDEVLADAERILGFLRGNVAADALHPA